MSAAQPKDAAAAKRTARDFHEEERLGRAYDAQLLRRLWPFLRPHRFFLLASLTMILGVAALALVRPLIMGRLVATAEQQEPGGLLRYGLLLSLLVLGIQALTFVQSYTMQIAGARSMADLRAHLFDFMQRLELRYYDRTPVGRLVTRATNDVDALGELFGSGVLNAIGDLVALVGIVIMMMFLDVRLSLITFAALPVVGAVVWYVRGRARQAYRDIRVKTARLNAFLNEQVSGMSVVQAYAREAAMAAEFDTINAEYRDANKRSVYYEAILDAAIEMVGTICIASILWWAGLKRISGMSVVQAYAREAAMAAEFDTINAEYRDANKRSVYYEAILDAAIEMVGTICIASILWWAGLKRISDSSITFPLVVVFTQYIKQFFEPVSQLAQRYTILQSAMSGAERIFKLLDETAALESGPEAKTGEMAAAGPPGEALGLENVTFGYKPGAPVLHEVSFHVRSGERIALVGATGAGKTTVTALLLRLYEHEGGTVRVLGKDVRAYDRRTLRDLFSVVPQDVFLFAGTVASNIAMSTSADDAPDLARVEEALTRIGALDLFLRRPGGLTARVDERGANFSAGERQLLAFARALYKNTPLLILDEATASIDSDTEARLQGALAAVMEGRTALIIAHRLSTIRAVDRIVVFHKGRVVEAGSHDELLAKGGVYARLYRLQFAQERLEERLDKDVAGAGGSGQLPQATPPV